MFRRNADADGDFSDEEDNDSLSEGEVESRDRLAVERKVCEKIASSN